MRHPLLAFLFLMYSMSWAAAEFHPKPDEAWPLVAKSSVIVTGTLSVPVEQIRKCLASGKHEHVKLSVKRDQVIKGNAAPDFKVRWFTEPRDYLPDPEQVIKLNGEKVLLFLTLLDDDDTADGNRVTDLFFAGDTPQALANPGKDHLQQIEDEVSRQEKVLGKPDQAIPPVAPELLQQVSKLIDATTREDSQMDAFRKLEALGWNGLPAMILLMDDRRDLAIPHIELGNPEGHFEGIRQYGPKKVVDAMASILNQITAENFGNIESGGTDRARKEAVDGWRMYLYYLKKGEASPAQIKTDRPPADPIEASDDFRTSVAVADKLMVYEGLPHPAEQRELAEREMKRKDIIKIAGHSFYTPAVPAKEQDKLKKLLGAPTGIALYKGPKRCGGFHPDYAIVWESGGKTYQVLICYACHEVCLLEGKRQLWYDLEEGPYSEFRKALSGHASKLPVE